LKNIDIIVIPETWQRDDIFQYFNLPGFKAIHVCRAWKRVRGISLYYKGSINVVQHKIVVKRCEILHVESATRGSMFN